MTRAEYNRILSQMESIRMDSYEAETPTQAKRMDAEYGRLFKLIEPYANGSEKLEGE